jgi:hypothetical protein
MKRLIPLCLLPLLAACEAPSNDLSTGGVTNIFQEPTPVPPAPAPLPPQVLAALPAGVPPSVVQQGPNGCYLLSIEVTVPPSGYPLRDAAGNPVCEGGPAAIGPIDSGPIDSGLVAGAAPAPFGAPPLAPGSITPPAPLAPLNPG